MLNSHLLKAVVIGEGTLPIRCAEILLARGWQIEAIVSPDSSVIDWANTQGLQCFSPSNSSGVAACLGELSFDCLFSIVNSLLLNPAVLQMPRHRAVNYHDGPLPRYAGLNAATWALMEGEVTHGITWHELTEGIDEGDLLVQVPVDIQPAETSLTLNVKCYEAAIAGFESLVQQLERGEEQPCPQDLSLRTYFAGWDRPWAAGLLDFRQEAAILSRLVRGLSFGPGYLNSLTLPKLWLGDAAGSLPGNAWVAVEQLALASRCSDALPGEVLAMDSKGIVVSTATEDVVLSGFRTAAGDRLSAQQLGLLVGQALPLLDQPQRLQALSQQVARWEGFWTQRLKTSEALKLTWLEEPMGANSPRLSKHLSKPEAQLAEVQQAGSQQASPKALSLPWAFPDALRRGLISQATPCSREGEAFALALTTALGAYLSRLNAPTSDQSWGDLAFAGPEQQAIAQQAAVGIAQPACQPVLPQAQTSPTDGSSLVSPWVPMRLRLALEEPMEAALAAVAKEQMLLAKRGSYATDLPLRNPQLGAIPPWPMAVTWVGADQASHNPVSLAHLGAEQMLHLRIDGEHCRWHYNPEQLTAEAIARFQGGLERFMGDIIAHPQAPLCQHSLLSAAEQQQLLMDWNDTEADYPWDCCIHHLFEQQVVRSPDTIALQFGEVQLTYAELNRRANQVAHGLIARGIQPDDPVGVHLDRSMEMIVALLGVLKAGGCYLPMDPDYPRDRRLLMVEDAEPKVILTQSARRGQLDHGCELCLDEPGDWAGLATETPIVAVEPHHLAYIIYTSGSTGRPKGVMIEHRSLSNFAQAGCADYGIGAGDRVLQFASISFDAAAEEIYPCLISGGTLVLRTTEMMESVPQFLHLCKRSDLTVLDLPTAYWHLLVAELGEGTVTLPASVRLVIIGGEAVNAQRVAQWQQLLWRTGGSVQLLNTYGPTEATVVATAQCLPEPTAEPMDMPQVTIGRPLSNVSTYILDRHLQPVPPGAAGELCIGGAGLARGYLKRPEKTAAQFVNSTWNSDQPERLYRTGDLARYLPNGEIEYLGRIDSQVKIRGFRIELGEIEAVLSQHPGVRNLAVVVREDTPGDKRLVAYLSTDSRIQVSSPMLQNHLAKKLPSYMIPAAFVRLEALPMTPNSKVDYKQLPQPDRSNLLCDRLGDSNPDSPLAMPQTPTEIVLAEVWEEILNVAPIGRDASFLDLGGDSLSAMRLCSQIERRFEKKLLLSNLFQTPVLKDLAAVIAMDEVEQPQNCIIPLKSSGQRDPLFFVNCAQDANQLAQYIGEDYPVYGLNLFGASSRLFNQLENFELKSLAQAFIDDIRRIQPVGPYYLSSYCGDTRMTLELAQEFKRQGDQVALLALIDPWWTVESLPLNYHWQMFRRFGTGYATERLMERAKFLQKQLLVIRDRFNAKLQRLSRPAAPPPAAQDVELYQAYVEASNHYKPAPYNGNTVLMFSEELQSDDTGEIDDVLALFSVHGYQKLTVPGYHHALFYPRTLVTLGDYLRRAIDQGRELAEQERAQARC